MQRTPLTFEFAARRTTPRGIAEAASFAEDAGFDGVHVSETRNDALIGCSVAALSTSRIRIATSIAVAFARNPMSMALAANDLQLLSEGRFALGLGSQVKPHIERRFSMPWSAPVPRMNEFIRAVRAIWASWETGSPLEFRGDFYTHTLMTPFFDPGHNPYGTPPVWLAGVGAGMTRLAGRVADGFVAHTFTTPAYLRELTLPTLAEGRRQSGREVPTELVVQPFVILDDGTDALIAQLEETRRQIAFYASTPAYRAVMDFHGWGAVADRLTEASRRKAWDELPGHVGDEMIDAFAVVGTPEVAAGELHKRFGSVATTISFNSPSTSALTAWRELAVELHRQSHI